MPPGMLILASQLHGTPFYVAEKGLFLHYLYFLVIQFRPFADMMNRADALGYNGGSIDPHDIYFKFDDLH